MPYVTLILVMLAAASSAGRPFAARAEQACAIEVQAPRPGDRVARRVIVSGTATLPMGANLWVLARHEGLEGWWPQGGGPARVEQGGWRVYATLGEMGELGTFEIAVVPVGGQAHQDLLAWVRDHPGPDYPPTVFPNTVEECPVPLLEVEKVSG